MVDDDDDDDDDDIMMDRRERRVEKRTMYRVTSRFVLGRFQIIKDYMYVLAIGERLRRSTSGQSPDDFGSQNSRAGAIVICFLCGSEEL